MAGKGRQTAGQGSGQIAGADGRPRARAGLGQAVARNWERMASRSGLAGWGGAVALFVLLTVVTQVGGILMLAAWWLSRGWTCRRRTRAVFVAGFYLAATLWAIPMLAKPLGRVPLPVGLGQASSLAPRSAFFWLANRHYVKPDVRDLLLEAAHRLREKHPGSVVHYLEGGFPFWDGFVMLPHLSHRNGKAVDLTFCYAKGRDGRGQGVSPSPLGYGIYERPRPEDPQPYHGKFSWLRWGVPRAGGDPLDEGRTRDLLQLLLADERTSKVLLELHLQRRFGIIHRKLRFQQLQAARHDDHLHLLVH